MTAQTVNQRPLSISIGIPTSFIDVYQNKALKTQQIGRIARAAAIFQVDEILLYRDKQNQKQTKNMQLISRILEYMETPQYLRKHLFGRIPELQFVGLLPPLRTPHHPLSKKVKDLKNGEIREGVVFQKKGKPVVDVGVEAPLPLTNTPTSQVSNRITVRIHRNKSRQLQANPVSSQQHKQYWGYAVTRLDSSLGKFLTTNTRYPYVVATSRRGTPLEAQANNTMKQWQKHKRLLLLFGSYKDGLTEILRRENLDLMKVVKQSVNFVLNQGTATIRTEEAVILGLSAMRFLERSIS